MALRHTFLSGLFQTMKTIKPINAIMNGQEMVSRLAQLWMVARCKCLLRYSRSESHLDCLTIEPWLVEQFEQIAYVHKQRLPPITYQIAEEISPDCTESLDSLQICGRSSNFGYLSHR